MSRETDENSPDVTRPLPIIRVERPSANRGAKEAREHLDGERCVFCDTPADGRTEVDRLGERARVPTCGGCPSSPEASFWITDEDAEAWRFCPKCGYTIPLSRKNSEMCIGCSVFRRTGELLWYLPSDHLEAIVEAAERADDAPSLGRSVR